MKNLLLVISVMLFYTIAFSQRNGWIPHPSNNQYLGKLVSTGQLIVAADTTSDSSSIVDIRSTTKGVLFPRMTAGQMAAVVSPANGLFLYNTSVNEFHFWNGSAWSEIGGAGNGWGLLGNAGTTGSNFIGTTDGQQLMLRVNNINAGKIGLSVPGDHNTSFGQHSTDSSNSGSNTAIGTNSMQGITGAANTAIGDISGTLLISGSYNTFLGYAANSLSAISFSTAIGQRAFVGLDSTIVLGDTTATNGVGIGTAYPSAKLDVRGSVKIVDGTQGAGKVLTSDSSGRGNWQTVITTLPEADSVTIYALSPSNGTSYVCTNCSGDGITGRIVSWFSSAWHRLKFE